MSADDEIKDETGSAYARASAMQAGRPAASTRAAILAEARKVAEARRLPAANEPWFRRRVAASIAASVLIAGVAMLLWRQVGPQQVLQTKAEVIAAADSAASGAAQPAADEAEMSAPAAAAPAAQSLPAPARARAELADSARQAANAAPEFAVLDVQALVQREFPDLLNAAVPPRSLWIVQDARGGTLRTGTLAEGESFDSVTLRLRQELPDLQIGAFEVSIVSTVRGTAVQVGVARAR